MNFTNFKDIISYYVGSYVPNTGANIDGIGSLDFEFIAASVLFLGLVFGFFRAIRYFLNILVNFISRSK